MGRLKRGTRTARGLCVCRFAVEIGAIAPMIPCEPWLFSHASRKMFPKLESCPSIWGLKLPQNYLFFSLKKFRVMYNPRLPMTDIPLKASLRHCCSKDCVTWRHLSLLFSAQSTQIWWHLTISGNRRKWSNFNSFWSPNVFLVSAIPCWSTWSTEASYLQVRPYPQVISGSSIPSLPLQWPVNYTQVIMSSFEIFHSPTSRWRTSCLVDG